MRVCFDAYGNKVRLAPDSPYPVNHPQHGEKIQFHGDDRPLMEAVEDSFSKPANDWWLEEPFLSKEVRARLEVLGHRRSRS